MIGPLGWAALVWAAAPEDPPAPYRIDTGDVLRVDIWGEQELSSTYRVGPDGLALPLIGVVPVRGLSTDEVALRLSSEWGAEFLREPQVTVRVETYASQPVQVLGAVEKPGTYFLDGPTSLLAMLARAGGIDPDRVQVKQVHWRRGEQSEHLDLQRLLASGEGDRGLAGGDVVYVPEGWVVYVSGQVEKPGEVAFVDGLTVSRALAIAGGPKATARLKQAHILRDGAKIPVPLRAILRGSAADVALRPGDQVVVDQSVF